MKKISLFGAMAVIFVMAFSFQVNAEEVNCPALKAGDLFKVQNNSAVYYVDQNLNRLYFPNSEIYHSWFDNFSTVVEISSGCVDNYPAPAKPPYGVNYRAGAKLVKVKISPSVYVIEPGNKLRKIKSEEVAKELYGPNWANLVRDVDDSFWPNYNERGEDLNETKPHDGMFVQTPNSADVYYVENGEMIKVDEKPEKNVRTIGYGVFSKLAVRSGIIETKKAYERPEQKERNENAAIPAIPADTTSSTPAVPAVPSEHASSTSATPAVPAVPANPTTTPTTPAVPAVPAVPSGSTTSTLTDTVAPIISSISASVSQTTSTIIWTTNEAATSQVEYGLVSSYGNTTLLDSVLVTSHSVRIANLATNSMYHYRVKSTDVAGNTSASEDMTFNTLVAETVGCDGVNSITDTRDINNPIYETVEIGDQCWLKRNLNVGNQINSSIKQANNSTIEKYCYNDLTSNCEVYGGLYNWNEAVNYSSVNNIQDICPVGWHVPKDSDWDILVSSTGGNTDSNVNLKAEAPMWNGLDEYGFSALPGGDSINGSFYGLGLVGYYWSATADGNTGNAFDRIFGDASDRRPDQQALAFSVRCIKD